MSALINVLLISVICAGVRLKDRTGQMLEDTCLPAVTPLWVSCVMCGVWIVALCDLSSSTDVYTHNRNISRIPRW